MKIQPLHPHFKCPTRGTEFAGALDLYMPDAGRIKARGERGVFVPLGFAAEVPEGHVALMLPRSGAGAKFGLALNNTAGVIDSDYRGEWVASLRVHNDEDLVWERHDRLLQVLVLPVALVVPQIVDALSISGRGAGGFGSTGK